MYTHPLYMYIHHVYTIYTPNPPLNTSKHPKYTTVGMRIRCLLWVRPSLSSTAPMCLI